MLWVSRAFPLGWALAVWAGLRPATASATEVGYAIHIEGTAARMVGAPKSDQYTWGGGGFLAPELTIGKRFGLELAVGGLGLAGGTTPVVGMEETGSGHAVLVEPGVRLHPFGRAPGGTAFSAGGIWMAGGAGFAYTGKLPRGALNARLGFDMVVSRMVRLGPTVGFDQIIETRSVVLPEDARMVTFGIHAVVEPPPAARLPPAPDDDPDRDTIRGPRDKCPNIPEDFDNFQDDDGCPDDDNDGDKIPDVMDQCRDVPEDYNGLEDADGCPDADKDRDKDTIPDFRDQCRDVPEDFDKFQDEDGCPEEDNDKDKIPDAKDNCINEPETYNGYADDDGCPDEKNVRVEGDEIVLDDRVYFRVNLADVQVRSWPLIQSVANLLKANPQYALVRVQGHADDTGPSDYNLDLSIRRSRAVRDMIVAFGVAESRLVVEGFGERQPAQSGANEGARQKNRRVELIILKRTNPDQVPPSQSPPPKPPPSKPPKPNDEDVYP
jgi:outer membrane protein OmpA-like peptidoglycan-associated protein